MGVFAEQELDGYTIGDWKENQQLDRRDGMTTWSRRAEWTARNTGGDGMSHAVLCPKCGAPHTKGVAAFVGGDGHKRWVRVRRLDTCRCLLTGMQEAYLLRLARFEERTKEDAPSEHKHMTSG